MDASISARNSELVRLFMAGETLSRLGEMFGITRERARQIAAKAGLTAADGGFAVKNAGKPKANDERRKAQLERANERSMRLWGVDWAGVRAGRADGTLRAYIDQRGSAGRRAIPFRLTYAEWLQIWIDSGHLAERGIGKGSYCMARKGDAGAYELGNVVIQLSTENSRDAVDKWRGKNKANPGVFLMYPGRDRAWHAKVGKVRLGYFTSEEEAVAARDAYLRSRGLAAMPTSIGAGRGWTLLKSSRSRPYQMVGPRKVFQYFATAEEARAAYVAECIAYLQERGQPIPPHLQGA